MRLKCIYSFNKYLLIVFHMPGTVLSPEGITAHKMHEATIFLAFFIPESAIKNSTTDK